MPKIKRKQANNARRISKLFKSKRGQEALAQGDQEEMMTDPYGRPINVVLPEAEVETDFQARDKDEQNIYNQLGVDGVMRSRAMQSAVRDSGQQFGRAATEAARFVPVIGDAIDAAEVYNAYDTGKDFRGEDADYKMLGGMSAAGLLLPNIIEKPAKVGFRALRKAAQKLKPFKGSGKGAAKAAPKEFKEVEEIMYADSPNKVAQQRETLNEAVDGIESLPSSRLREKARDLSHRAENINLYEGDIFSALEKGQVDNPFNMQAQRAAFEKFGLKSGDSGNTSRYFNWLSVRQPELVEQIAKGNDDALYRAMNDKSLADGFMNDAETAYRGVDMSSDNPNVRRAIKDPERIGERVSGEGVYTTRDPQEAFSYATRDEPIRDVNEAGQEYFSGQRITRKGSVAEVQTDIDYDTPLDMIGQLDTKSLKGASRRDSSLPDGALSSIEGNHKIFMQGEGGAKFKIKQIIPQKDFKGLDMKFWGSMDFDPNLIDKTYFRNMSNNEAFKQAEAQFKSLRDVEIQKLRRLAKMYDVAGTVARATEAGIVVTAPTVAILKGSSYLNGEESTASDQKKFKVKKKGGMKVLRDQKENSNSTL